MQQAKIYFLILLGSFVALESCVRIERDSLFESTHRALFKLAMYRKHGRADALFLGTSRTGEAMRPNAFLSAAPQGIDTAFNCSVQYSSLDILEDVVERIANDELAPKLAIIEISRQQLVRAPLPWRATVTPPADFEEKAAQALSDRFALMRLRKAFVLDSLARYAGVALFARQFDGSEQFGVDYLQTLLDRRSTLSDEPPIALSAEQVAPDPAFTSAELNIYKQMAAKLKHTRVIFYAPPQRVGETTSDELRQLFRGIATVAPMYDFSSLALPDDHFRDNTHMSHKGGLRFSRDLAALLRDHARDYAVQ